MEILNFILPECRIHTDELPLRIFEAQHRMETAQRANNLADQENARLRLNTRILDASGIRVND